MCYKFLTNLLMCLIITVKHSKGKKSAIVVFETKLLLPRLIYRARWFFITFSNIKINLHIFLVFFFKTHRIIWRQRLGIEMGRFSYHLWSISFVRLTRPIIEFVGSYHISLLPYLFHIESNIIVISHLYSKKISNYYFDPNVK